MTFWPLTNGDLPTDQTFHQFHDLYTELDLHRIMSGFHGAFAKGVASQQGTLTLPDTWFRPRFWDLLMLQLLRPNSSNLPCLYSTFHLEYPLVLSRFCLLRHFRFLLWTRWTKFNETWQEADLNVLYQVCAFGADQKNKMAVLSDLPIKVAHCTQVQDMWPFLSLVLRKKGFLAPILTGILFCWVTQWKSVYLMHCKIRVYSTYKR